MHADERRKKPRASHRGHRGKTNPNDSIDACFWHFYVFSVISVANNFLNLSAFISVHRRLLVASSGLLRGFGLAASLVLAGIVPALAQTVPLYGATQMRFATAAESRLRLGTRDAFVAAMSAYDRSARTGRREAVSEAEFMEFAAGQALDWQPAEIAKLSLSVAKLREQLRPLQLPLPKEVWLVKTTGREEAETPYTRGNAIILPQQYLNVAADEMERVILHELFHVISRHVPERRNALYAIVGYRDCGPLDWPPELAPRRITNPDAPDTRYCITLQRDGAPLTFYPVLFAKEESFDPVLPGTYLDRLLFKLMAVMGSGTNWIPGRAGAALVLLDAGSVPEYFGAIGLNTRYIIHPEEILADNFVFLVRGERKVRTPRILDELERVLAGK